jgi:long-chain acyl-CoA synthetase
VVSTGAGNAVLSRPGSVGKPLPVVRIRINDPDPDGTGEILVRSPSLMLRYWGASAAESIIDDDRWLYTGDLGHLDDDGYLYVTDRSKDMVIRGGENVASAQVEGRLLEHAGVEEAAVIGLPHSELGEEVAAIVVLRPGIRISEEDLAAFAAQTLAYFAVPTRWWLREAPLPKNPTGKVMKPALRAEWLARSSDLNVATAPGFRRGRDEPIGGEG